MADIPEHLLQRSTERRKALGLPVPGEEGGEAEAPAAEAPAAEAAPRRPPAAEARGRGARGGDAGRGRRPPRAAPRSPPTCSSGPSAARRALAGGGGRRTPRPPGAAATAAAATATLPAPTTTGPGGHTQRLLTVVKSGSIQQTRAEAQDKVHTWPHLLVVEFAAILSITAVVLDLLGAREGAAARPRRRQPDAEPVEGAVVLPRVCRSCSRCSTRWSRV